MHFLMQFSVLLMCVGFVPAQGNADERLNDQSLDLLDLKDWPSSPLRDGIILGSLKLQGWIGQRLRSDSGHLRRRFIGTKDSEKAILINAHVMETIDKGRTELLKNLATRQSDELPVDSRKNNLKIGDICFLDIGPKDMVIGITFIRGNVLVSIINANARTRPQVDIVAVARRLDESILKRPRLKPGEPLPRPSITELAAELDDLKAGAVVPLKVKIVDPVEGIPHVRWVVGGTGQGYVEKKSDKWYLHTTKSGRIALTLEATGATGTFASKTINILVLPRRNHD